MDSIYIIQQRCRITEKWREHSGEHSRETTDDQWISKVTEQKEMISIGVDQI